MRTAGGILVYHYSCKTNPTEDITVIFLVQPRKPHYFKSEVFYSNTLKPFQSPIESHSVLLQNVTLETIGIERCVDNKDENPTTWKIYFLSDGWVIFYQLHYFLLDNSCPLVPRLHLTLVFTHVLYHATIHRNWNIKEIDRSVCDLIKTTRLRALMNFCRNTRYFAHVKVVNSSVY